MDNTHISVNMVNPRLYQGGGGLIGTMGAFFAYHTAKINTNI